jgi:hypothetical protein
MSYMRLSKSRKGGSRICDAAAKVAVQKLTFLSVAYPAAERDTSTCEIGQTFTVINT